MRVTPLAPVHSHQGLWKTGSRGRQPAVTQNSLQIPGLCGLPHGFPNLGGPGAEPNPGACPQGGEGEAGCLWGPFL